ncbi:protein-tyrosine-phosphatase [Roseivirga sp.]|uniref:protein-tyrosine-phosphatase n=1 Tax=Roseivirga sp. TaxID=1964215 RepID=UPI003B8D99C8
MFPQVIATLENAASTSIPSSRYAVLDKLVDYCVQQLQKESELRLNFICTHNSRRSQFSQVWAVVAAAHYNIPLKSYSGGIEVTAFNERAIAALERQGLKATGDISDNPHYKVSFSDNHSTIETFSKLYDDPINPSTGFAAVMTCSDADENCPFIPGTDARIPLRYEDPKAFDGTDKEAEMYSARSIQIASEMLYIFNKIKETIKA